MTKKEELPEKVEKVAEKPKELGIEELKEERTNLVKSIEENDKKAGDLEIALDFAKRRIDLLKRQFEVQKTGFSFIPDKPTFSYETSETSQQIRIDNAKLQLDIDLFAMNNNIDNLTKTIDDITNNKNKTNKRLLLEVDKKIKLLERKGQK